LKNYKTAITVLNQGKDYIIDNNPLLAQFYAYLGDANYQIKDNNASDSSYEKSLSLDSTNGYVLNNYAYYLSLRGVHLDKAEKMARKATQLDPGNSANEDTYGWILYKMDHYQDAEKWIKKALDDGGDSSAVILEHYGDVLYKMENKAEAIKYWEKAKKSGPASEFLDKKIKDGKLYE
jgi:Tfp pilus assembly protein PilF